MTDLSLQLLAPSDIADMAGVTRAAVSNWRRRNNDFPEPRAGTAGKPLFDAAEVRSWLTRHGHQVQRADSTQILWGLMNRWRGVVPPDVAAATLTYLMAARVKLAGGWSSLVASSDFDMNSLMKAADLEPPRSITGFLTASNGHTDLRPAVDAISGLSADELPDAADELLSRSMAGKAFAGLDRSAASRVMARAAGDVPAGSVVYDPACGYGWGLFDVLRANPEARGVGVDISQDIAAIARCRAVLRGLPADVRVHDTLVSDPAEDVRAAVAVCEPPFGMRWNDRAGTVDPRWRWGIPPQRSAELVWVQDLVAHLDRDGRGYILTTHGAISRTGREARIRAELIRQGCVEAVVGLPGNMYSGARMSTALWVLRSPDASSVSEDVLFIDADSFGAEEIVENISEWLRGTGELPPHGRVPRPELAQGDADLSPRRWVAQASAVSPAEARVLVGEAEAKLNKVMRRIRALTVPRLDVPTEPARLYSVKQLQELKIISIQRGQRRGAATDQDDHLRLTDLRAGSLPDPGVHTGDGSVEATSAGDVLMGTVLPLYARVDRTGGHLLSDQIVRFTPDPAILDPDYLAACLRSELNEAFSVGAVIQRVKVLDLQVPLLPMEAQESVVTQLQALDSIEEFLPGWTADATDALIRAIWAGAQAG